MNQKVYTSVLLSLCLLTSCIREAQPPQSRATTKLPPQTQPIHRSNYFQAVELTPEIEAACTNAISKMDHFYPGHGDPANTMADAQKLLWDHFSIQETYSPKSCVEFNGWFLISQFNTSGQDDGSFTTGMAVKKGTTEMYPW